MQAEQTRKATLFAPGPRHELWDDHRSNSLSDVQVLLLVIVSTITFICGICLGWVSARMPVDHSGQQQAYGRYGHL